MPSARASARFVTDLVLSEERLMHARHAAWLLLCVHLLIPSEAATLGVVPGPHASGKAFVSGIFDDIKLTCFLDTGSAMTLLADRRFGHYPNLGSFHFKSASGIAAEAETLRLSSARIDRAVFRDVKVGRFPEGAEAENTLGIDLLGRQSFSVNFYQNPSLELAPRPPRSLFSTLEVHPHGLLVVPMKFGGSETRAMWDTGASITAVDEAYVRAHPETFKAARGFMQGIDGAGQPVVLKAYRAKRITIGARNFRNVHVVATDLSLLRQSLASDLNAVIGFNLIRKTDWFFDPQRKVWSIR